MPNLPISPDRVTAERAFAEITEASRTAMPSARAPADRAAVVTSISDKFAELLRRDMTKRDFTEMKKLNETPEFADGACASHNYLDANMTMDEAFTAVVGHEADMNGDEDTSLWNDAWNEARDRHIGRYVEKIVRAFSCAGPCLTLGRLTHETAKFYCFEEWKGGDKYEGAKKVAKPLPGKYSGNHVEPCPSCRDHVKTQYPNGYQD